MVSVLAPAVWKVSEQLPAPAMRTPLQDGSPATLELTEYVPVGTLLPLTLKVSMTGDCVIEGFGVSVKTIVELAAFTAPTDCVVVAAV